MLASLSLAASAMSLAACAQAADSSSPTSRDMVADSAGVRIVAHRIHAEALEDLPQWRLASTPEWTFSHVPSRESSDLLGITGAVFLNSGVLAVGHGSTRELLLVDTRGHYVRAIGANGSGPGELRSVRGPFATSDEQLVVYDVTQRRISRFDTTGTFLGTRNVVAPTERDAVFSVQSIAGVQANGDALFVLSRESARARDGAITYDTQLAWLDSSNSWRLAGPSRAEPSLTRRPPDASGALGAGRSPLAPRTLDAICGDGIATVGTHDVTINRRTTRGELVLSIRTDRVARAADVADFAREMGRPFSPEQRQSAEMQRAVREMHAQFPNATAPLVSDFHCDDNGNMVVSLAQDQSGDVQQLVLFGSDGTLRGQMQMPAAWRVLDIAGNRLAITTTDNDDMESVSVWQIISPI